MSRKRIVFYFALFFPILAFAQGENVLETNIEAETGMSFAISSTAKGQRTSSKHTGRIVIDTDNSTYPVPDSLLVAVKTACDISNL
ncbi:MAG: hypothetical protein NC344_04400 [Bacteroidales bacterium]|nr:hypothetical protein [Bacteroidales bacterium]MCM1147067.1 hypothetical protein [Bacteroidales bacterium]MCM1205800.1 hypothetical protein [Bacillota bacterium]MCM1509957.1 hypothetical protein [Clostridium sp.]